MQTIPLAPRPSQTLSVALGGQSCKIAVFQKAQGVFISLSVGGIPIITSVVCLDRVRTVRYATLGFIGDLAFVDTHGQDDPDYTGFGERFKLAYIP